MANETTPKATASDPTFLGVELPLNLTLSSAKTVADAWKTCIVALTGAVKEKIAKPEATKKDGPSDKPTAPMASA